MLLTSLASGFHVTICHHYHAEVDLSSTGFHVTDCRGYGHSSPDIYYMENDMKSFKKLHPRFKCDLCLGEKQTKHSSVCQMF